MPIQVQDPELGPLTFDTVDELVEYRTKVTRTAGKRQASRRSSDARPGVSSAPGWEGFCSSIAARQDVRAKRIRKMMALVKGRGDIGITWAEISKALGDKDESGAYGTFSGLSKNLQGAGINPQDVIVRGSDKRLRPGPLLAANEPPTP